MASFAKKKNPSFFRISFEKSALKKTNHILSLITRSIYISCSKSQLLRTYLNAVDINVLSKMSSPLRSNVRYVLNVHQHPAQQLVQLACRR